MLKELEHFGELWPYIFILFTKANALGDDDGTQRYKVQEFLQNPRCPDSLKLLMRRVDGQYIMLESVQPMSGNYHQDKCYELIRMVEEIFARTGKVYTNVLFDHALQVYEKAKKDEMDKEQALIRARQDVENLGNQLMAAMKSAQEAQEQQQRIFQQALDKLQGDLDAARIENAQPVDSIRPPKRKWWERVIDVFIPGGCTIQ
ncbi:uncharacterized protein [Dysidea avara]|uniref:uncharacterized protein n=1 Tax=Dysidea avara TaxID=196820 RepID=UPI00332F36CA